MLPRSLHSVRLKCAIFLAVAALAHAQPSRVGTAHVEPVRSVPEFIADELGKGTMPLGGPWQFHPGDDMGWAEAALDDSRWAQISADKPWGEQGYPNNGGYGWYRRHIAFGHAPDSSAGMAAPELAVFFPSVQDAYEVYWNGAMVGHWGTLPPHPHVYSFSHNGLPAFPFDIGPARSGVLAVRVWKAPPITDGTPFQGGFMTPPVLGDADSVGRYKTSLDFEWLQNSQFTFALNSLYALAAALAFLAWFRDRKQNLLFWMTGYCIAYPIIFLAIFARLPLTRDVELMVFQPAMGIRDISLWFLLLLLLHLDEKPALARWVRMLAWAQMVFTCADAPVCAMTLSGAPGWSGFAQKADVVLTVFYTLLEALPLVLILYAITRGRRLDAARWLVAGFAFLSEMVQVVYIASEQGRGYTHWTLAEKIDAPLFTLFHSAVNVETLSSTLLLLSIIYAVYRYSAEERRRQASLEQEFRNARELQQVLIPDILPEIAGFTLTSAYKPALEVGGDFFQIIPLQGSSEGSTLVVLGDVSGKGLRAAMAVSLIVGATRMAAEMTTSPAGILVALNRRLDGRLNGGFATCVVMRLDAAGLCTISSAGHPAPFINGREAVVPGALPLGLVSQGVYEETEVMIRPGDHLALCTDGLLEARGASGELYGFDRLRALFESRPTAEEAAQAAVQFGQDDDITVLMLVRVAASRMPEVSCSGPVLVRA
jgi:hypothetical protein